MTRLTNLVEVLQEYTDALQQAPQVYEGSDLASLTRVYSELCKLVQDPFALFDLYDFMQAWDMEGYPPETVRKIIETVQKEFVFDNSSDHAFLSKARQSLASLKQWCKDCYPHSPESRLLACVAESLLEHLESIQEAQTPASVDVYLSPSLDLGCPEEEEDGVYWRIKLPVALTNKGGQIAAGVNLLLTLGDQVTLQQDDDNFEESAYGEWRYIVGSISSGQTKIIDIPMKHIPQSEIDIDVEYLKDISSSPEKEKKRVSYVLPIPQTMIGLDWRNPYIPDAPLTSEWHWDNMVKGNHDKVVERIMSDIESSGGPEHNVYIVRGLRRTGKTSTLEGLKRKLNEGTKYLPVYIDFYRWFLILRSKGVSLDDNKALLYEIACAAAREARRRDIDVDFGEYFQIYDESVNIDLEETEQPQMDFNSLDSFIIELSAASQRKVVFLLDELDWCIRARELLGQGEKLDQLIGVVSALARTENCTAILAHEWPTKEWEKEYEKNNMSPTDESTQFLGIDDLRELAKLTLSDSQREPSFPPLYTEMAIQYIWRITGGWPGLAQLIFYWIFENIDKRKKTLITVSVVKGVVKDILESKDADAREFITYLLGSFDAEEISFLKKLSSKIVQESSMIPGIQRVSGRFVVEDSIGQDNSGQILDRLGGEGGKQIIEPVNEEQSQFRLRVGLLSYPEALALYQSEREVDQNV